ncbi:cellulase family glycosylhydrolase [Streptacidiphilus jiangxiensis]|uniref:Aryl-phospho-beta-D-glucosidase BglC, GH1 family n=1 Tax=Streptacidiphilus jiangxiensis TaxID=235985 RepID=A0A1H7Z042_STRJI|nr:cellulase family glycosylhydrolase [Streptacidiphilus jiangxiensis]SEM51932.1 Aryl-phospho-beta-D-glucosidase BglC, GH1 family [Streptacidiphilus jiangxiensis]
MKATRQAARHRRGRLGLMVGTPVALIAAGGLVYGSASGATTGGAPGQAPSAVAHARSGAMAAVAAMQPGWNLGNSLDAIPAETSWGNPVVAKAQLDAIRAQGFRSIRIPVTWSGHQGSAPGWTIDPAYVARIKQVVNWALADGFYVVLNVHHDSWQWIAGMPADHDGVLARYDATWTQLAAQFRDESDHLVFESVNEPTFTNASDAQKAALLDELNTSFHRIVRASGGANATRLLVLPTIGDTPSQSLMNDLATTIASLHDDRIIASLHYYGYWPFSSSNAGVDRFDAASLQDMTAVFTRMHDTFVAKGIPLILGEYGLLSYPDINHPDVVERGEALKYFEEIGHQERINGITGFLWDNGAYLDRTTLRWRDPGLFAEIKDGWTTRSGTASSDQVFVPASEPVTARTLTLNPNGTAFRGLFEGRTALVQGRDYTLADSRLTLTPALLARLTAHHGYGVAATLTARFSAGAAWQIRVVSSATPVLSGASGSTSGLTVPAQFRGDVLATVKAHYSDGSNAGPNNWTPFLGFDTDVVPDSAHHTLTLSSEFFQGIKQGAQVTLTVRFWSGATVTYHVTAWGSSVTGTAS